VAHLRALFVPTAVIALVFGISPPDPDLTGEPAPVPFDHTLLVADQSPNNEQSQVQFRQSKIPTPR
jgi:hypothetical protein